MALAFAVSLLAGILAAGAQNPSPSQIKAAYLYRFTDFVEWPASAFVNRPAIELCVVRPNPFGADLQRLVAGQARNGHSFVVRELDPKAPLDRCHVLFVPTASVSVRSIVDRARDLPILTVGDDDFLRDGGMIALRVVDGRMRFEIATGPAERAHLRISSQLLQLALAVR